MVLFAVANSYSPANSCSHGPLKTSLPWPIKPEGINPETQPGISRGYCPTDSGDPEDLEKDYPDAYVIFKNIRIGEIDADDIVDDDDIDFDDDNNNDDDDKSVPAPTPSSEEKTE